MNTIFAVKLIKKLYIPYRKWYRGVPTYILSETPIVYDYITLK